MPLSDRGGDPALSRRSFVGKLATGAAAVASVATIDRAQALTSRRASVASSDRNGEPVGMMPEVAPAKPSVLPRPSALPGTTEVRPVASTPPWDLLRPLSMGSLVAHGWRVAGLAGVEDGSCILTLENLRGRTHRIHICRNDGRPFGLVYTGQVDLVVMNGGQGDLPTEEGLAQAVAAVAHVLAANEGDPRHAPIVTALLPQAERVRLFANAAKLR